MDESITNQDAPNWIGRYGPRLLALLSCFIFGLALSRILYEGLFPALSWIGYPMLASLTGLATTIAGFFLLRTLTRKIIFTPIASDSNHIQYPLSDTTAQWSAAIVFLPFTINLAFLFDPAVNLAASRFLFFSSLWLFTLFVCRLATNQTTWRWLSFLLLIAYLGPIYLVTLGQNVGSADTFEFQVVVPRLGIVHPTGYPLYLLLGKLFSLLPFKSVAWRVNLGAAIFGLAAVSALFILGRRLTGWSLSSLIAAALLGLTPTFWSQAIQAEVYTLHAFLMITALLLIREIGDWRLEPKIHLANIQDTQGKSQLKQGRFDPYTLTIFLALVLGLGLTNHLTTLILLSPALLSIWFAYRAGRYHTSPVKGLKAVILLCLAFLLPLLLYAYLPIRWAAVNGEPMGLDRLLDWVIGGRFQGALQLDAWLRDGTRYDIVGRLFTAEWRFFWTLLLIFVGAANLLLWQWRYGLILLLIWLGFLFYTISYYVPDLAVFLLPAQVIFAIWWLAGIVAALALILPEAGGRRTFLVEVIFLFAAILPFLVTTAELTIPQSINTPDASRTRWAEAVLELPLDKQAAILADSDKFPPLYYLQQAEGLRPDLDIMVLPDEDSYRAELDAALGRGQTVYLARFLPGLQGIYHLNSIGPLIEVSPDGIASLPEKSIPTSISFGPIQLLGYELQVDSPYSGDESALTLYWQASESPERVQQVYLRWIGDSVNIDVAGQHPANNSYPTVAWEPGEIVVDYHNLPKPSAAETVSLQVALGPPFARTEDLPWQTLLAVPSPVTTELDQFTDQRIQAASLSIDGVSFPEQLRPQSQFMVQLRGWASEDSSLLLFLMPDSISAAEENPGQSQTAIAKSVPVPTMDSDQDRQERLWSAQLSAPPEPGTYELLLGTSPAQARCGWFSRLQETCQIGRVQISGVQLPEGAINFDDHIALLAVDVPDEQLQPGGQVPVNLTWQALAPITEDYTVFIQILDAKDRIVGQVDSWPLQGTYPTSQWQTGEIVADPYLIQLDEDLPSGPYKLYAGLYLLETLGRLPIIDDSGHVIDDKAVVSGLYLP